MNTKNLYILLAIVLLNSCTSNINSKITEKSIINNYLEAIGGYNNLKRTENIIKNGHYIEPAYNIIINAKVQQKRPNYRVIGQIDISGFEEGFNGKAWEYHRGKGLIFSEGEAKEVILVSSDFDYPFIDAQLKGNKINLKGLEDFDGQRNYNIEVRIPVMGNEYITNFYFDPKSFLLTGQRKVMPIHAVGDDVKIVVKYSDYRSVNGVLFPFSQIERNEESGIFLNATIWSEIITDKEIPLSHFNPPELIKHDLNKR